MPFHLLSQLFELQANTSELFAQLPVPGFRTSVRELLYMAATVKPMHLEGVDVFNQKASLSDLFGDLKGRLLLEAIWNTYQARLQ